MKRGKSVVRVRGLVSKKEEVFKMVESIVSDLDAGTWDGRKNVFVK